MRHFHSGDAPLIRLAVAAAFVAGASWLALTFFTVCHTRSSLR